MTRRLSPRQAQVVAMIVEDPEITWEEIGAALGVTAHTAKRTTHDAYLTIRVHTRTELVLWAIRQADARRRYGWLRPLVVGPRGHSERCGCSVCFIRRGQAA